MMARIIFSFLFIAPVSSVIFAQDTGSMSGSKSSEEFVLILLVVVMVLALTAIIALSRWLLTLSTDLKNQALKARGIKVAETEQGKEDTISRFLKKIEMDLTDAVPVEREEEIEMDHEYDGIRELDNNLPPWWKYLFYLSIVYAIVYMFYYHVSGNGKLMLDEYEEEMAMAALQKEEYLKRAANLVDENSVTVLNDESSITKGKKIYINNCLVCHGAFGEGGVGPNFADQYWLHGGSIHDIFATIKYGVPAKGMISWQGQLKPVEMQEVASYILTLQGTNPPNAKDPEGELYIPPAEEEESNNEEESI